MRPITLLRISCIIVAILALSWTVISQSPLAEAQSSLASVAYEGNVLPNLEPDPAKRWTAELSGATSSIVFENGTDFLRIVDTSSTLAIYQRIESAAISSNRVDFEFRARFFGVQSNACFGHADENFRYVVWKLNTNGMQIQPGTGPTIAVADLSQWHVYRAERDGINVVRFYIDGDLVAAKSYLDLQQRSGRARSIHFGACGTADTAKFDLDYLRYTITPASPEPNEVLYPADTLPNNDPVAPWIASTVTGGVSLSDGLLLFRDTSSLISIYQRNVAALQVGASWTMEFRANYRSGTLWVAALSELNGRWAGICFGNLYQSNVVTDCGGLGISSTSLSLTIAGVDPRGWHTWRVEKDGLIEARIYRDGQLIRTAPYLQLPVATARKGAAIFGAGGTSDTADLDLDYLSYRIGPITPVNSAPVASNQSVTTNEDGPVAITLAASDVNGDALTFGIVANPNHGMLSGTAPNLIYTPAADYSGPDSFTFKANDGTVDSNTATVSITVTPINDQPIANGQSVTTNEDTAAAITLAGSDIEGNVLTFSVLANPTHGVLSATAPNLTYTPTTNYNGFDSFTFKVNDGALNSNTATVSITVTPVNDAPVSSSQLVTTNEDTAAVITLGGSDIDGNAITFNIISGPAHGTFGGTAPRLTYTPAADYSGPDSFTFKANDGSLDSNIATVSITVTPINDQPVANGQSVTTNEDTAAAIILTASDVDGDALVFSILTSPGHGTLSGTLPNLTYIPAANYYGPDSFSFKVNDGALDSNTATVSITVTPVNDAPVSSNQSITTNEDTQATITVAGSDIDSDSFTLTVTNPSHGTLSGTAPNLIYTPAANYNGMDSFTFKANDGSLDSNIATVSITINPVNDPPVAAAKSVITPEDTSISITLTGSDVDGDPVSFTVTVPPAHGTLSGSPPAVTYSPALNYNGPDQFSYVANDGRVASGAAAITISITPVNDAPDAVDDQITASTPSVTVPVLANDVDVDGDRLIISNTTAGSYGTTTVNTDGTVAYLLLRYATGADSFSYSVVDGNGGTDTARVVVTLQVPASDGIGIVSRQIFDLPLNNGEKNSLINKLDAAQRSLSSSNPQAARGQLTATINEIQALQRSGRISSATADVLISQLRAILGGI